MRSRDSRIDHRARTLYSRGPHQPPRLRFFSLSLSLQSAVNCFQLNCLLFSRQPFAVAVCSAKRALAEKDRVLRAGALPPVSLTPLTLFLSLTVWPLALLIFRNFIRPHQFLARISFDEISLWTLRGLSLPISRATYSRFVRVASSDNNYTSNFALEIIYICSILQLLARLHNGSF